MNLKDLMAIGQEAANNFGGGKAGGALGIASKMGEAWSAIQKIRQSPNQLQAALQFAKDKAGADPAQLAAFAKNLDGNKKAFVDKYFPGGIDAISKLDGSSLQNISTEQPQGMPSDIAVLLERAKKK